MCWHCPKLDSIMVPASVKRIGRKAFQNDASLTFVESDETLDIDVIDDQAFESCTSLEEVNLRPAKIGKEAFAQTSSLKSFDVLSKATSIGEKAFFEASMGDLEVHIPESLTEIGENALDVQQPLCYVVASANPAFTAVNDVLFDKQKKTLIKYPTGYGDASYTVPDGVETIGENAFDGEGELTEVKLPDSLTKIEDGAFYNCGELSNIVLNNNLKTIGSAAFSNSGVKNVVIPDSVTTIGANAWADCEKLESASIGNGLDKISEGMFHDDIALKTVKISDKLKEIAPNAFLKAGIAYEDIDMGANHNFLVKDGVLFSGDGKKLISYPQVGEAFNWESDDEEDVSADAYQGDVASGDSWEGVASGDSWEGVASGDSWEGVASGDSWEGAASGDSWENSTPDDYYAGSDDEYEVKEYKVPDGVEVIGEYAFAGIPSDSVNKIYIPDSVKTMEYDSFGYVGNIIEGTDYLYDLKAMDGAYIIASEGSAAYKYAVDNQIGFFTEDCSGNATEMGMSVKDKKSYEVKGAVKGAIMYFSDDKNIAKIDAKTGAITPVAKGSTTLIAASGNKYLSCKLTVTDGPEPKKESTTYKEYSDNKSIGKWNKTYMAYNNSKAYIRKHYPAVHEYSGNDYSHIVAAFYPEDDYYFKKVMADLDGDYYHYIKLAKNLSYELHQAKTNTDLKLFRGTTYVGDITGGGSKLDDIVNAIGKTYVSGSVSSTSLKHGVASGFSDGGFVLEIDGDKNNIPGMYIASFAQFPNEAELLLADKTTYKVLDAGVRIYHGNPEFGEGDSYEKYIKLKIVK